MYVHLYGRFLSIFLQLKGISFQESMEKPLPWDLRRLGGFCTRGNGPIPIQVFCTCCLAEFHGCCTMKQHLEIKLIYVMCIIYIYVCMMDIDMRMFDSDSWKVVLFSFWHTWSFENLSRSCDGGQLIIAPCF